MPARSPLRRRRGSAASRSLAAHADASRSQERRRSRPRCEVPFHRPLPLTASAPAAFESRSASAGGSAAQPEGDEGRRRRYRRRRSGRPPRRRRPAPAERAARVMKARTVRALLDHDRSDAAVDELARRRRLVAWRWRRGRAPGRSAGRGPSRPDPIQRRAHARRVEHLLAQVRVERDRAAAGADPVGRPHAPAPPPPARRARCPSRADGRRRRSAPRSPASRAIAPLALWRML